MVVFMSTFPVSENTKRVSVIIDYVKDLTSLKSIDIEKIKEIIDYINNSSSSTDDKFINYTKEVLESIIADGIIDNEELLSLENFASKLQNPISDDPEITIAGKCYVLTGDFNIDGSRDAISYLIKQEGGRVTGSVSSKTDYVVMGSLGSSDYGLGSYGNKVKRAIEDQCLGKSNVQIISEDQFFEFINNSTKKASKIWKKREHILDSKNIKANVAKFNSNGFTKQQQKALDLSLKRKNLFISGLGGTGKSYIVNEIVKAFESDNKNVIKCASTGISAINIGGSTIHKILGIKPEATLQKDPKIWIDDNSLLVLCDLLIVDEISMCRMDLFDYLSYSIYKANNLRKKKHLPNIQLIVVGDLSQLAPVLPKSEKKILEEIYDCTIDGAYPFSSKSWSDWNFTNVDLSESIRQSEKEFVLALNQCRYGNKEGLKWITDNSLSKKPSNAINLFGRNKEVEEENRNQLSKLKEQLHKYEATIEGDVDIYNDTPFQSEILELKRGARVMSLINDRDENYMNGSLGFVRECFKDGVVVLFDNGYECELYRHKWDICVPVKDGDRIKLSSKGSFDQIPLKLAYAITIHKSQGQTFDVVSIDPECWDYGQLYTALSRVRSIGGLHIRGSLKRRQLLVSEEVINYYIENNNLK